MGVSGASLRISGREDGVNKNESPDDLSRQSGAFTVPGGERVGPAAVPVVVRLLERLDEGNTAYGPQALGHHVHQCPD